MANRKYDYSEEMTRSLENASEMAKTSEATKVTAEESRQQRLERRNDALANEFRKLKPEIADAHKQLQGLIDGIGVYANTMQNLQNLLETSFPIRFSENDRQALQKELNAIANNTISQIRKEREKAAGEIQRNDNRISMTCNRQDFI